ncbi:MULTISPECIES: citrate synthase [unclassified Pseudodesulfovibrio]|uniref:citrate synthase n=1 Tax=unclassified Pseudodesulfovibrio TaxID=2661612 RepID=UPI000FEC1C2B|nr:MULTISPECIES: citrate synthase [unclassified Pseudodesulfovibrio]MCJ2163322.1 citrate synthase [Pseudodesulfovibrio sp. S3-i]RWU06563.1 citrate synthase [Pseudodesulfovibrio sp. S3]
MLKDKNSATEKTATLTIDGKSYELPIIIGTEKEQAIDISRLRTETGCITYDPGYANTGSCLSEVTFVDGENGILRYRGYPIEELAANGTFIETAYLLIFGNLPTRAERQEFRDLLSEQELLHEDLRHHFEGFPSNGHPMAILSAVINSLGCYHPDLLEITTEEEFLRAAAKIISKVRTIAAWSYRKAQGLPFMYPDPNLSYCRNFLHMMHSIPNKPFDPTDAEVRALTLFFLLHADHEQNCSTSTVRMVQSTEANLFASVSAGICALWGRLHGGANAGVIQMLNQIHDGESSIPEYLERVKKKEVRLMGFGHRIYKSFDPRAKILRQAAHDMLESTGYDDPLLDIALELAEVALNDDYFTERKLYPNVDFYSGIILRALGIPVNMFPVMFAIGRMPGWIAHWNEANTDGVTRIHRPRQIYTGCEPRVYIPLDSRI